MKREIKFRVYSQSICVMYDPDKAKQFGGNLYNIPMMRDGVLVGDIDDIYMQFTGLKDKNGKEIYEGDIVKCSDSRIASVVWQEWKWMIQSKPFSKMEKSYSKMDKEEGETSIIIQDASRYGKLKNTEIIGNIYENPELL